MSIRINLHRNPCLSVSDSQYFGGGLWARTTGAHASLPRTTAWAGNTTGINPALGRVTTVPGKYYALTFSVRAIAPTSGVVNADWKTAGDAFLSSTSGDGSDHGEVDMAAGSTARFGIVGIAPATGERMVPVAADWSGSSQITAVLVRQFDTLLDAQAGLDDDLLPGNYFDGDSPDAVWDGTTGLSSSTLTADEPGRGRTTFGAQTTTATRIRDYGTGATTLGGQTTVTGLLPAVVFDQRRGRIRVSAVGMSPEVVRAEVSSRPVGTSRWTLVRGGKVAVSGGRFVRTVDDYEFTAGEGMQYRIQAITTLEEVTPPSVAQSVVAGLSDTLDQVWLKFIVNPTLNRRVSLTGWGPVSRASKQAVFGIRNRSTPIVVTDVHGSRSVDIELVTFTEEEGDTLEEALASGLPVYFQTPTNVPLRSMYASVGTFFHEPFGSRTSVKRRWRVPLTEVAPPPASIVAPGYTYAALLADHATYSDVLDAFDTYLALVG